MTYRIGRYSVEDLLGPGAEVRVMTPVLTREPAHWHDFYELAYVVEGSGRHVVNGAVHELAAGSVFLLSPTDVHEIQAAAGAPLRLSNVVIAPRVLERQLDALIPTGTRWQPWLASELPDVQGDFARLLREASAPATGSEMVLEALVQCIVVALARSCGFAAPGAVSTARSQPEAIRRAVSFVERHFRDPITLAEAASMAHLSPNYFSEQFRVATGSSFQSYLQHRRLQFAHSLLASTDLGVSEVCHASGFNSLSHFGRAFRRRYGVAPSALRSGRAVQAGDPGSVAVRR